MQMKAAGGAQNIQRKGLLRTWSSCFTIATEIEDAQDIRVLCYSVILEANLPFGWRMKLIKVVPLHWRPLTPIPELTDQPVGDPSLSNLPDDSLHVHIQQAEVFRLRQFV